MEQRDNGVCCSCTIDTCAIREALIEASRRRLEKRGVIYAGECVVPKLKNGLFSLTISRTSYPSASSRRAGPDETGYFADDVARVGLAPYINSLVDGAVWFIHGTLPLPFTDGYDAALSRFRTLCSVCWDLMPKSQR